ncbi:MAG: hypothetical protein PVJ67_06420 [Candidatus Pacearchaeota archaeon]|jgi:hypothetical protein
MEYLFKGLPPKLVKRYFPKTYQEEIDKRKTFAQHAIDSVKKDLGEIAKCFRE